MTQRSTLAASCARMRTSDRAKRLRWRGEVGRGSGAVGVLVVACVGGDGTGVWRGVRSAVDVMWVSKC